MADDVVSIIRVETGEAVKSVNDLKENVKILKERLGDLQIGSKEYQDTLEKLHQNQNAIKDAMYATNSTMEQVASSAKGLNVVFDENNKLINRENQSYNALVHTMAELKTEFRSTTDVARRMEIGDRINQINDALKDMDAMQGNFQRNVGNYQSAFKGLGDRVDGLDKGFKAATRGLGGMKGALDAASKTPALVLFGLLANAVMSLASNFKESETGTKSLTAAMVNFEPVIKFFKGVFDSLSKILGDIILKVSTFLGNNGLITKIINGIVGVGNALLQYVIAPFKGVIAAVKVFQEDGVKGIRRAAKAFGDELDRGIAFKSNFNAGKSIVEGVIAGVQDKKEDAKKTATDMGKEVGKTFAQSLAENFDKTLAEQARMWEQQAREKLALQKELDEETEEEVERTNAEIERYFEEQNRLAENNKKIMEENAKAKIAAMQSVSNATSSILGSLADIYESDEENSEKNAKKIKALRIASATIDTISGAIGAFTSAAKNPGGIPGMIIGAANAATITAAGIAQIAKMKSVNFSGSDSSSTSISAPALTSAPVLTREIPQVRSITSAQEEDRLNRMAGDQRVVLVMSDLEVKQTQNRVRVAEASF